METKCEMMWIGFQDCYSAAIPHCPECNVMAYRTSNPNNLSPFFKPSKPTDCLMIILDNMKNLLLLTAS